MTKVLHFDDKMMTLCYTDVHIFNVFL